jgi:alkylation response protein AidB-like acyl-CoA dehydrogenase
MVEALFRSDEQRLLADTASRLFAEPGDLAQKVAEAGLLALPFAESDGGFRPDGSVDGDALATVFAAKGMAYAVETSLLQAALGGTILAASQAPQARALLADIIDGRALIGTGLHEAGMHRNILRCATRAERIATGWRLDGVKTLVLGGDQATHLLVLARIAGHAEGPARDIGQIGLFLLDRSAAGIDVRGYQLRDRTQAMDLHLAGVVVGEGSLVARGDSAAKAIGEATALVRLCLAAEAAGLMRSAVEGTIRYTAQREQFGKPIAAFQVIQHRLADMAVAADQAAAVVSRMARDVSNTAEIGKLHGAVAELGMTTLKAAIQLHGGYGITEDLPYGQALRRMMAIGMLF